MGFSAGDIAACYGTDWTSRTISWATSTVIRRPRLGPSHVAILCPNRAVTETEDWHWIESTTLCGRPCRMAGVPVSGVQWHHPQERIDDYLRHRGRVDIYRLREIHAFEPHEQNLLWRLLLEYRGTRYDLIGAMKSGSWVQRLLRGVCYADLESLFCSELIAELLMRFNRLIHANPSLYHPGRLVRDLLRTGKYELSVRYP